MRQYRLDDLEIVDLTVLLQNCESKIISGKTVMGFRLHGFKGMIGRELQPGYRVGSEFSGRAKVKAGVKGIFHSDELPAYGIGEREIKLLNKKLKCGPSDAFVLVAGSEKRCRIALEAVHERAGELLLGVPKEVRKAKQDGTTSYLRPMPGAARMYPETDVPFMYPYSVELPELLEEKIKRFQKDLGLSFDLATFVAKSNKVELFEELVKKYNFKAAFIADVLTAMLVEVRRKYNVDTSVLKEDDFRSLFDYLESGKIHKDIVLDVLIDMCKGSFDLEKYKGLSTEEIHSIIAEVVSNNKGAPFGALMGKCMKELAGKASGQVISAELKKLLSL